MRNAAIGNLSFREPGLDGNTLIDSHAIRSVSFLLDVTLGIHIVMTFRKFKQLVSALHLRFNEFPSILVLSAKFQDT